MTDKPKKSSTRFPLRLPDEVDAQVRDLARGDGKRPPAGINETILFLIQEGLKAVKKDGSSGPLVLVDALP